MLPHYMVSPSGQTVFSALTLGSMQANIWCGAEYLTGTRRLIGSQHRLPHRKCENYNASINCQCTVVVMAERVSGM